MADEAELTEALRTVGQMADEDINVAETALLLGALDYPDLELAPYRQHLDDLASAGRAASDATASVGHHIAAITRVLYSDHGYEGDTTTYDDPRNANLIDVIDRRRGLPVALGILGIHVCRAFGGKITGLSFPSHFLLRLSSRGQQVIIDPFDRARPLDAPDLRQRLKDIQGPSAELTRQYYHSVSNRDVLVRLLNNIKTRAVAADDQRRAIEILDRMMLIAPERGELWWETAVLHSQLGNLRLAIATLEDFLAVPAADDSGAPVANRTEVEELLRRLRGVTH